MSQTCPACSKPLLFAPRAPEHTPKKACIDPNCVNAHGIIHEAPFDRWEKIAVEYNETTTEKENTMTNLTEARSLANNIEAAQQQFENYIRPLLQDYLTFLPQRGSNWATHYTHAHYFTFVEIDRNHFLFEGYEYEEYEAYGDYARDHVSLPFDFVAAPESYKSTILAQIKAAEEKKQAQIKATAEERVAKLKAQLAKAEEDLAKAAKNNDPISTIASRNQAQKLRDDLAQSATPEQG